MSKCYDNPEYDDTYSDIQNTWNQHPKVEQEHETKVMKNLYILQTDKPSRLACDFDKLILNSRLLSPILYKNQNIYITSDEEIKRNDYWINVDNNIISNGEMFELANDAPSCKKIILTTDQDLINDGIQAIDDEFLEWFVKNPSCEEVKILRCPIEGTYTLDTPKEERKKNFYCGDEVDYDDKCLEQCDGCVDATGVDYGYLPEEETKCYCGHTTTCDCGPEDSKQNIIDMMKGDEELGLYDEIQPEQIWNEEKKKGIKQLIQDHKKETLEEFAERLCPNKQVEYDMIIEGANWQQDKICNSEVLQRIRASKSDAEARRIIRTL